MKKLLKHIVSGITGSSDFEIEENKEGERVTLNIVTATDLIGIIIGKGGNTIRNIRKIISIRATLDNKLVNVMVNEKAS